MTDKELRRLSRRDLMELLLHQAEEMESLKEELAQTRQALEDRRIRLEEAGSIAQASLAIHGVMDAAQAAAEEYLENIRLLQAEQQEACRHMEAETRARCEEMLSAAREEAQSYWEDACRRVRLVMGDQALGQQLEKLRENGE